jgi:hypothetical protein
VNDDIEERVDAQLKGWGDEALEEFAQEIWAAIEYRGRGVETLKKIIQQVML